MKRIPLFIVLCAIFQLTAWTQQPAQPQAAWATVLEITGDIAHPHAYQEQEWKQLKHVSVTATNNHDKKTATYSGVLLYDLLKAAGVPTGDAMRGKGMKAYVMVTAGDGYQVLFALSELDEEIGHLQVDCGRQRGRQTNRAECRTTAPDCSHRPASGALGADGEVSPHGGPALVCGDDARKVKINLSATLLPWI